VLRRHVVMFVYSSLVALCYGTFRLAQVIQTTVVSLPVYNRHQEFTVFTVVFLTVNLFVRVDHAPPAIIRHRPLMEYRPLLEDLRYMGSDVTDFRHVV